MSKNHEESNKELNSRIERSRENNEREENN